MNCIRMHSHSYIWAWLLKSVVIAQPEGKHNLGQSFVLCLSVCRAFQSLLYCSPLQSLLFNPLALFADVVQFAALDCCWWWTRIPARSFQGCECGLGMGIGLRQTKDGDPAIDLAGCNWEHKQIRKQVRDWEWKNTSRWEISKERVMDPSGSWAEFNGPNMHLKDNLNNRKQNMCAADLHWSGWESLLFLPCCPCALILEYSYFPGYSLLMRSNQNISKWLL